MKTYFIAAAILAVVGLLPAKYFAGYRLGKSSTVAVFTQAAQEYRDMENTLLVKLEKAKKERKIVHMERIKAVTEAADVCLDSPVPGPISSLLYDLGPVKSKSVTETA